MKRLLRHLFMMLVAALTFLSGGCVHEFPDPAPPVPPEVQSILYVSVTGLDIPFYKLVEFETRAAGHDLRYSVHVFEMEGNRAGSRTQSRHPVHKVTVTKSDLSDLDHKIPIPLKPGDYRIVVWVDYVLAGTMTDLHHNTADFTQITLNALDDATGLHPGNLESRQVFIGSTDISISEADLVPPPGESVRVIEIPVEMERPQAKFRFVTTDLQDFLTRYGISPRGVAESPDKVSPKIEEFEIRVRYMGYMPYAFNANINRPYDSKVGQWFVGKLVQLDQHTAEIAFDYVFVNGSESIIPLQLEVYRKTRSEMVASTPTIDVPVVRGKLTEIRGRFLTTSATGGIGIDPGFSGEFNIEIE